MGRIEHLYAGKLINEEAYICIYSLFWMHCMQGGHNSGWKLVFVCFELYCIADLISSWNLIGAKARTQKAL